MGKLPSRRFWKMTGSGNDFVFFDAREEPAGVLETSEAIGAVCDRRSGVGADGVVFLEPWPGAAYSIRYFNRDGSLAEFCGNASLCSATLAAELDVVDRGSQFTFQTTSGLLTGRTVDGQPEISMPAPAGQTADFGTQRLAGETRIGFATVGVPHVVVLCQDLEAADVIGRGRELRSLPSLPAGANANFVAGGEGGWAYRTYERGVEDETLACGSGSVAVASLLEAWGLAGSAVTLRTRSGAPVTIDLSGPAPMLAGEGRLVFEGRLRDAVPAW